MPVNGTLSQCLPVCLWSATRQARPCKPFHVNKLATTPAGASDPTPWYAAYRDELLRMLSFGEHETFDHPVACEAQRSSCALDALGGASGVTPHPPTPSQPVCPCRAGLLVLPADHAGDLALAFNELWDPAALPRSMQQGMMEPRVLRHYVLLHDARHGDGVLHAAEARMRELSSTLGSNCHVVTINSGTVAGPPSMDSRMWTDALRAPLPGGGAGELASRPPQPPGGVGAALTQRNVDALAAFVHELAVRSIIPHLEARVRTLNHQARAAGLHERAVRCLPVCVCTPTSVLRACADLQVSTTRKGLRNQLKSLLWRKSGGSSASGTLGDGGAGSAGAATQSGAGYHYSSVESQMRQLADLALMLGDCETAATTLRLLASDFKSDRAYKHYAGVQEALGAVAALAPGGSVADAVACMKEAFYRYNQVGRAASGWQSGQAGASAPER